MNDTKPFVSLDADHIGTLLVLMSELHIYWNELWETGELETPIMAEQMYLLGNIEGRCICSHLTQEDLDLLEAWEEELTEWKEAHGGCLIPIDDAIKNSMDKFHGTDEDKPSVVKHKVSIQISDSFWHTTVEADMTAQDYATLHEWVSESTAVDIVSVELN